MFALTFPCPVPPALLLAAAATLHGAVAYGDTYPRQPGVDAIHYVFRLAIDDGSDRIEGDAAITFKLARIIIKKAFDSDCFGLRLT